MVIYLLQQPSDTAYDWRVGSLYCDELGSTCRPSTVIVDLFFIQTLYRREYVKSGDVTIARSRTTKLSDETLVTFL